MIVNQKTTTTLQLREKELHEIIIRNLVSKDIKNTNHHVDITFTKQSFSTQKNGLNAYDEDVVNIIITKNETLKN